MKDVIIIDYPDALPPFKPFDKNKFEEIRKELEQIRIEAMRSGEIKITSTQVKERE